MDTNALKKFAAAARNLLIDQVTAKLDLVLADGAPARREHPQAVKDLDRAVNKDGRKQIIEQVAYTWFNRFTALRFMDVNGYTQVRVVSPAEGATRPEILSEAIAGHLPDGAPSTIQSLLDGRTPSHDPQAEAYRLLLVHACNQWHGPMPFLFEQIDDYTELLMPEDLLSQTSILTELRKVMTEAACRDVEIIGWLYQFYISEKKDQVFAGLKKNQKITAENIPAATQLFTPHWIVRYLVENSLGRLWLLNRPESRLAERMDYYIAPEEPETDFLKITRPEEIRICDPAAGSGHMLTYAFDLLYAIYEEEGYDATEIPSKILTHNLTGVEIDDRAGALAAFALAMKAAARLGRRRFLRMEAKPDICVLQNLAFTEAEMQDVAAVVGKDLFTDELRETLGQFEQAKNFGSLIVPKLRDPAETLRVVEARDFGGDLLLKEVQERVVSVLRMAEALSPKYHVVVANPPYMGGKGMNSKLAHFAKKNYPDSKVDLYAMFIERTAALSVHNGYFAMINLPSWLFLSSFAALRSKIGGSLQLRSLLHMGRGIFGVDWGSTAFVGSRAQPSRATEYFRLHDRNFQYLDARHIGEIFKASLGNPRLQVEFKKYDTGLSSAKIPNIFGSGTRVRFRRNNSIFSKIPGNPFAYWLSENAVQTFDGGKNIHEVAQPRHGLTTGNNDLYLRLWFEVSLDAVEFLAQHYEDANLSKRTWFPVTKGGTFRKWYGNNHYFINYLSGGASMQGAFERGENPGFRHDNKQYYFQQAATWSTTSSGKLSMRYIPKGFVIEHKGSACFSPNDEDVNLILSLTNSKVVEILLSALSPTLDFSEGAVSKIPVCRQVENLDFTQSSKLIALSKDDWDAYETSWDFTTLPLLSPEHRPDSESSTLEATYATLRAHWQSMTDEMKGLEEENNRIFIDAYGLQDELTPEVPIEEITLTCNPAYRYGVKGSADDHETRLRADTMAEFLSYAVGCMFGRYSLDAPGLILANQGERLEDYLARIPEPRFMPDADNVIPVLDGDWFPDDITERFRLFLRVTFGEAHFRENLRYIEDALGKDIRKYFTRDFYADHVKRYKKRPIYWMVSSPKGTFNALIYMHRYRGDTVSVLLNDYLREFITKLEGERARLEKLSDDATATQGQKTKALKEAATVAKQIDELNDWEREVIFPLAQQKIEIDLDDGVKANYPKFGTALKKIPGLS